MTTKRILTASITILAIGGMIFMSIPAQAGFFDWFGNTPLNQEAATIKAVSSTKEASVQSVNSLKTESTKVETEKPTALSSFFTRLFGGGSSRVPQVSPISLACNQNTAPWIRVISPNGGESYIEGSYITVKWDSCNLPTGSVIGAQLNNVSSNTALGSLEPVNVVSTTINDTTENDGIEKFMLPGAVEGAPVYGYGPNFKIQLTVNYLSNGLWGGHSPVIYGMSDNLFKIVGGSQMTAVTLNTPASQNILAGTQNFVWAELKFSAADSSENIEITGIQLEATKNNLSANVNGLDNFEIWADLNGVLSDSPRGDRYESLVSNTQIWIDTGSLNETRLFTLTQVVTVPINQSVLMAAIGDVSVNAVVGSRYAVSLDNDMGDVVAYGASTGNSVSVTPVGQGQEMKIIAPPSSSLTVTVDSSSPASDVLLDGGQNGKETLAVFRLSASQLQSLDLDSFKITDDGTDTAIDTYHFQAKSSNGNPLGPEKIVVGLPTAEAHWMDGQVVIPANGYILMEVSGLTKNAELSSLSNGDKVRVTVASAGDVDTTGLTSGTAIGSTQTSVDASIFYVFESYPEFEWLSVSSTTLTNNANHLVGKLKITANGDEDVTFQNADGNKIPFRAIVVRNDNTIAGFEVITVKKENGTVLDTALNATNGTATLNFDFSSADLTIAAGGSQTLYFYMNTADLEDDNDSVQLQLSTIIPLSGGLDFGVDGQNFANSVANILLRQDHMMSQYSQMHINPA